MPRTLLAAAAAALLSACAVVARTPEPAPVDPVGRYQAQTIFDGQQITVDIEVTGAPGAYAGTLSGTGIPMLPLTVVTVEGQEMRVAAETPDGPVTIRMSFMGGDDFTGAWELAGMTGELAGRRLPSR